MYKLHLNQGSLPYAKNRVSLMEFGLTWLQKNTVIRDSKCCGGIVGITRQKMALIRWSLTRHVLTEFTREMRNISGTVAIDESFHEETKPAVLKRDESHVNLTREHVKQRMTNLFDVASHPKSLVNMSTGLHAPTEIEVALTNAFDNDIKMVKAFVHGALAEGNNADFYSPISRSKLKTFTDLIKTPKLKCGPVEILNVHISPELIFRRALVLAGCREDVTIEKILSFPIGPVPISIFHENGTMRKTSKADLSHQLESQATSRPEYFRFVHSDHNECYLCPPENNLFSVNSLTEKKNYLDFCYTSSQMD
jgi:hypothetical protein